MPRPPKDGRTRPDADAAPAEKRKLWFRMSRARNAGLPPSGGGTVDLVGARLNKFVARCGIASRRQAADYIKEGLVKVNGKVVLEPFYQMGKNDKVSYRDKPIQPEERLLYILLNKPRGVITTVKDDRGRDTVIDGFGNRIPERIFPVGRLDRDTSGLLLLTNDGDLAKKMMHPSHEMSKIYQVTLDKLVTKNDLEHINKGVELDDGLAEVDWANYTDAAKKKEVTVELHSGRNRVIRRIFETLGYSVKKLDRTYFGGLTKKDLPRGYFRYLTEKEIITLKHLKPGVKKPANK